MHSGREVVGAATIPPVGAYVSAFSVKSERCTTSAYGPSSTTDADHAVQWASVRWSAASASGDDSRGVWDGDHVRTKGTVSPSWTVNSAIVFKPSPRRSTGLVTRDAVRASDPPARPAVDFP